MSTQQTKPSIIQDNIMDSVDVQELIASLPEIKVTPPEALPSDESSKSELQGSKNPFPMRARFWRSDLGSVTAHFPDEKEDIQKLNNAWFDTYPWLALKFYANIEHSLDSLVAEELSDEAENPPVSDSTEPEATPEEQESNSQQNNSGTPKDAMMAAVTEYIEARHARKEHTLRRTNMFRYGFSFPIVRDYLRLLEDLAPKALFAISNTIPRQVAGRYSEQVEDIIHAIDLIESGDLPKMCLPSPEDVARLSTDELATLKAIRSEDPEGSLARRACERFAIGRKRNLEHHQRRMGVSAFMAAIRTRVARRGISQNFLLPVVNDYRTTTLVDLILRLHSLYSYKDFPADNTKEETPDLKELRGYQIAKSRALVALQEYTAALNFDAKTHDNDLTEEIHEEQHDVTGIILSFYSVITNEIVRGPSRDGETSKEGDTGDSSAKPRRPLTAKAIFDITKDYLLRIQNRSPGSTTAGQEQVDFGMCYVDSFNPHRPKSDTNKKQHGL